MLTVPEFQLNIKGSDIERVAIVVARFNKPICEGLLQGALKVLQEVGLSEDQIEVKWVPGAFEIPIVAQKFAKRSDVSGVITLGCVIRGDTAHFDYVCLGATHGTLYAGLQTETPVAFGILMTENERQAIQRSSDDGFNKGREAAAALLETLQTLKEI